MKKFRAAYSSGVCIGSDDDSWRCANVADYVSGQAPILTVRYLGVWDTVGAMGIPKALPFSSAINREHAFHDPKITDFVCAARHAVAIDERRRFFPVELFGDLEELNAKRGKKATDVDAPYQERWFPGTHGSVGGGGDIRGLSDGALHWVLKGAVDCGLRLDVEHGTRIHGFAPNPLAPLINSTRFEPDFTHRWLADREGPDHFWQISAAALRRWHADPELLLEKARYRPASLSKWASQLDAFDASRFQPVFDEILTVHTVEKKDNLTTLAKVYLGDRKHGDAIFRANLDVLDDPHELFVGQKLRIPKLPNQTTMIA